jgi:PAS domain S-box-containing protein
MSNSNQERSANYFKGIFEIASEGVVIVDASGHILKTNPAFDDLLGYTKDELKGKLFTEVIHKRKALKNQTSRIKIHHFQRSRDLPIEIELISKEKVAIPVRFRSVLLEDDAGKVVEAIGLVEGLRENKGETILEKKVQETEETLQNVLANSGDAIILADANGHITDANEALLTMLGYQESEVLGKHVMELSPFEGTFTTTTGEKVNITEEYVSYQVEKANELFEKGTVTHHETYQIRKDGMLVPVESTLSFIKDQKGGRKGTIAICRDVTERRKTEQELKNTRDFLENVYKTSADGLIVTDFNKASITMVNPAIEKMLGYSRDELLGKHPAEFSPKGEQYQTRGMELVAKLNEEGVVTDFEFIWVRNDGSLVDIEINAALLKNNKSDLIGSIISIRDISKRKKIEKEARETREFLENIFKTTADGILVTDGEGSITMVNETVEKMLGYACGELIGKNTSILNPEGKYYEEEALKYLEKLLEEGVVTAFELAWLRKDGNLIAVEVNAALLKDNENNFTGSVASIRDITERKEMEAEILQSKKLQSLGELAGGVAHNFNNILAVIIGRANLLQMNIDTPPGMEERRKSALALKKGLAAIEKASQEGADVVRKIQEFTRESNDDAYIAPVNINKTIDDAIELTRTKWKDTAESKGIKIEVKKDLSSIPSVSGNHLELKEVFSNLINNAIDAMPQGGDIKIRTFKQDNYVFVSIEDTGVGLPDDKKDSIFDPFFTTKGPQSRGLGLSAAYGIINRHRGTIAVDSIAGQGTSFTIKVPFSKNILEAEIIAPVPQEERKARILVIEDEEDIRGLLKDILTDKGHKVETVSSGMEGVKLFEKKKFDLVFTDLGMPRMSGWEVAEKIKCINKNVPVYLITGWNVELEDSEMKEKGVDFFIKKPFTMNHILNVIQEGMMLKTKFEGA